MLTASCGSGAKDKAILAEQASRLNISYSALIQDSQFVRSISFAVDDKDLKVDVVFKNDQVNVEDFSHALVKYALAQWLKGHTGADLDEILNALGRLQGELELTLTDADGDSCDFDFNSAELKHMVRLRPMELDFNEVRANVQRLMTDRCDFYKDLVHGSAASFRFKGGFAEYTITFPNKSDYRNYTQAKMAGTFSAVLRPQYKNYGAFKPFVEELLQSLQIEGYRFIFTTGNNADELRSAIPWRLINVD